MMRLPWRVLAFHEMMRDLSVSALFLLKKNLDYDYKECYFILAGMKLYYFVRTVMKAVSLSVLFYCLPLMTQINCFFGPLLACFHQSMQNLFSFDYKSTNIIFREHFIDCGEALERGAWNGPQSKKWQSDAYFTTPTLSSVFPSTHHRHRRKTTVMLSCELMMGLRWCVFSWKTILCWNSTSISEIR